MESSDDEIIDNNNDEGDFDIKLPESKAIKSNKIQIKPNPKPTNDIPKANTQVKNVSIASLSLKQSPKSKQIISVSIVNPKNAQTIKKNMFFFSGGSLAGAGFRPGGGKQSSKKGLFKV